MTLTKFISQAAAKCNSLKQPLCCLMDTSSPFATIPSSREERWQLMRDVITDWFPPLSSDDGYPNPVGPVELPLALREWYQLCFKRPDIWSRQDHFHSPLEFEQQDNRLTIIVENQSCGFWVDIWEMSAKCRAPKRGHDLTPDC